MSTILDALRKLEEDKHAHNRDARTRLLQTPTRLDLGTPRKRRTPWVIGAGIGLFGFAAGAGLMLWGPRTPAPGQEQHAVPAGAAEPSQPVLPPPAPLVAASPAAPAPASPPEQVAAQTELPAQPPPAQPVSPPADAPSLVQRSPFVASVPEEQRLAAVQKLLSAPSPAVTKPVPAPAATAAPPKAARAKPVTPSPTPGPEAVQPSPASGGTSLSFLQWSSDPERRLAFIRVNGGPTTLAHEGDTIGVYTVIEIRQDAVVLRSGEERVMLRARD